MSLDQENIRIIFGLKLKQLRQERGLSLTDLAARSEVSVSYLNEIEKGKKYPKADKISVLAQSLGVDYDRMVSLKVNKNLVPIQQLLNSNFMKDLPLELFGIEKGKMLEVISNAPLKANAFISSLIELARNYDLNEERFYHSLMRSYQELNECYFDDIENEVDSFKQQLGLGIDEVPTQAQLSDYLTIKFGYRIDETTIAQYPELIDLRAIYQKQSKTLLLNSKLSESQKSFLYAKENAYQHLKLTDRAFTTPSPSIHSFEQVMNKMKSSYFAGAMLLPRQPIVTALKDFIGQDTCQPQILLNLLEQYDCSVEMLQIRILNLSAKYLGLSNLFFLRVNDTAGNSDYQMAKEFHLGQLHNPHGNSISEHYCRRWLSLSMFQKLRLAKVNGENKPVVGVQRSKYLDSKNEYFIIAMARWSGRKPNYALSVNIGFLVNAEFKKRVKFWADPAVPSKTVNITCERCSLSDCANRVAPATQLIKLEEIKKVEGIIEGLMKG